MEAHDEFRPPIGKRIADINFNTVDDLNYKLPASTSTLWKTKISSVLPEANAMLAWTSTLRKIKMSFGPPIQPTNESRMI